MTTSVSWQRFLAIVVLLTASLVVAWAPPTTAGSARSYAYDGPAAAHVDDRYIGAT